MSTARAEYLDRLRGHLTANQLQPEGEWLPRARRLSDAWPGAATLTSAAHRPTVKAAIVHAGLPDPLDGQDRADVTDEEVCQGYAAAAVLLATAAALWSPRNRWPHLRNGPSVGHALGTVPTRHLDDDTLQRLLHLLLQERPEGLSELVLYLPHSRVGRVDLMSVAVPAYVMAGPPKPWECTGTYPDRGIWLTFHSDVRDLRPPGVGGGDHGGPYLGRKNPDVHPHLRRSPRRA